MVKTIYKNTYKNKFKLCVFEKLFLFLLFYYNSYRTLLRTLRIDSSIFFIFFSSKYVHWNLFVYHISCNPFFFSSLVWMFLDDLYRSRSYICLLIYLPAENSSQVEMSLIVGFLPNRSLSQTTPMARLKECMDGDSGFCCQLCREGVWPLYFIFGQNGKHLAHWRCPSILHRPALSFPFGSSSVLLWLFNHLWDSVLIEFFKADNMVFEIAQFSSKI